LFKGTPRAVPDNFCSNFFGEIYSQTGLKEIRTELCHTTTATSRSRVSVLRPRGAPALLGVRAPPAAHPDAARPEVPRPEPPWRPHPHVSPTHVMLRRTPPVSSAGHRPERCARVRFPLAPCCFATWRTSPIKGQADPRACKPEPLSPRAAPLCLHNRHRQAHPLAFSRSRVTPLALSLVPSRSQAAAL
jgi:hypothetical protein